MDYLMPLSARIARSTFSYVDSTGVSVGTFTGVKRTTALGGDRIGATLELTPQLLADRAMAIGFLMQLRGRQNRAILIDHASRLRGVFPSVDVLPNGRFNNGLTGWSSGSDFALTAQEGVLRSLNVAATGAQALAYVGSTFATVAGAAYVARFMLHQGRGTYPSGFRIDAGTTPNSSNILTGGAQTVYGLLSQAFVASGAAATIRLMSIAAGTLANYVQVPYATCARCVLVDGASQAGSGLAVKALPISSNGLLLTGDLAEVITTSGSELHYTTAPLNADSSGKGYWQFEPPLRGSPADGAPIVIHQPMGRFLYTGNTPLTWSNDPGVVMTASYQFEEAASANL